MWLFAIPAAVLFVVIFWWIVVIRSARRWETEVKSRHGR